MSIFLHKIMEGVKKLTAQYIEQPLQWFFILNLNAKVASTSEMKSFSYPCLIKGQEKWSSVRITDSKKNSIKVENHVSTHSNLNLNGLDQKGLGKEVKLKAS